MIIPQLAELSLPRALTTACFLAMADGRKVWFPSGHPDAHQTRVRSA